MSQTQIIKRTAVAAILAATLVCGAIYGHTKGGVREIAVENPLPPLIIPPITQDPSAVALAPTSLAVEKVGSENRRLSEEKTRLEVELKAREAHDRRMEALVKVLRQRSEHDSYR